MCLLFIYSLIHQYVYEAPMVLRGLWAVTQPWQRALPLTWGHRGQLGAGKTATEKLQAISEQRNEKVLSAARYRSVQGSAAECMVGKPSPRRSPS